MTMDTTATATIEGASGRTFARRRLIRAGSMALTLVLVVAWFVLLRPSFLGGPASYLIVSGTSMLPALESGDLVLAVEQRSYVVGDVVVYHVPAGEPGAGAMIIHRIVGGDAESGYIVRGDNREGQDPWRPRLGDVVGRMRIDVPGVGRVFVLLRQPAGIALVAALTTFLVAFGAAKVPARRAGEPD